MSRIFRFTLATLIAIGSLARHASAEPRELPIQVESGWSYIPSLRETVPFKTFRRYSLGEDGLVNIIMFNCSLDRNTLSNIVFEIPKEYEIKSFTRDIWLPNFEFRIIIDGGGSDAIKGEYRNAEIFIDLTSSTEKIFHKIMLADNIDIGFGDQNDIIKMLFTEKMDAFMSDNDFLRHFPVFKNSNHYARYDVFKACDSARKRKSIE